MQGPVNYFLDHNTGTVSLTINDEQLLIETQGKGIFDKLQGIDISLSDLKYFCLVPVMGVQRLRNVRSAGDQSYDSEIVFSYSECRKMKIKRVFVDSKDASFEHLLEVLKRRCPDAGLLHLVPAAALKLMGAASPSKTLRIFLSFLIGLPVMLLLIYIIFKTLHH